VVPELSKGAASVATELVQVALYPDADGPSGQVRGALREFRGFGAISVEENLTIRDWNMIRRIRDFSMDDISPLLADMRAVKDPEEIELIRRACQVVETSLIGLSDTVRPGVTELDLALALTHEIVEAGGDSVPFCLVQAGPSSSVPHAEPSKRKVATQDLVLVDVGCTVGGYNSDITRVYVVGGLPAEEKRILEVVRDAQEKAESTAGPGVEAGCVDEAARRVIEEAGYGENFIHRTGHGIGIEVHEPPYIHAKSNTLLTQSMVFTVEPGIYLPGRMGIRLEDDVLVTADGVQVLSRSQKAFL
jgi:Xaa-Pro aminopeptidase